MDGFVLIYLQTKTGHVDEAQVVCSRAENTLQQLNGIEWGHMQWKVEL